MAQTRSEGRQEGNRDVFVLIPSPLVGPLTWDLVADELRQHGERVIVPDLGPVTQPLTSFWGHHTKTVAEALRDIPEQRPLILVGHSGAGALLPAIGHAVPHDVSAYLFVDAPIPTDGQTRLGTGPFADFIRALYASGDRYPNWTSEDLREIIPDPEQRQHLLDDVRPPPLGFWEEPIPVFAGWPDAMCGYLRFTPNPAYDEASAEARRRGWAYAELPGGHFHLLVEPNAVAEAILDLLGQHDGLQK